MKGYTSWIFFNILFALLLIASVTSAQVTIKVIQLPENTPEGDSVFITGTFNKWAVKEERMRLLPQQDGSLSVTLTPGPYAEYKFSRGDWGMVEGDQCGNTIPNRSLSLSRKDTLITVSIASWMDQETVRLIIDGVPSTTPQDAAIFLCGPFNQWNPADPHYRFEKLPDGRFQYILAYCGDVAFKFTRGTLESMDCDAKGNLTPSHRVKAKSGGQTLSYTITAWEDLTTQRNSIVENLLTIAGFIGLFISIIVFWIRHSRQQQNYVLTFLLVLIFCAVATRILLAYPYIFYNLPKLVLIPALSFTLLAPALLFYIDHILNPSRKFEVKDRMIEMLLFILPVLMLLPVLIIDNNQFAMQLVNRDLPLSLQLGGIVSVLTAFYYLRKASRNIAVAKKTNGTSFHLKTVYDYTTTLLVLSKAIALLITLALLFTFNLYGISDAISVALVTQLMHLTWIVVSFFPLSVLWFMIVKPELFSESLEIERLRHTESPGELKNKLEELMTINKPYLDPELSLNDLSKQLQVNPTALSRIVSYYDVNNFYDFVNGYRIAEFKRRIENGEHKIKTILAIANEVGFKSKTTFNRTFKKINGVTPRDYLYAIKSKYG